MDNGLEGSPYLRERVEPGHADTPPWHSIEAAEEHMKTISSGIPAAHEPVLAQRQFWPSPAPELLCPFHPELRFAARSVADHQAQLDTPSPRRLNSAR